MISDDKVAEILKEITTGEETISSASRKYNVSRPSIYSWLEQAGIDLTDLPTKRDWDKIKNKIAER